MSVPLTPSADKNWITARWACLEESMARSLTVISLLFQSATHCRYRVYTKFLLPYIAMCRRNRKVLPLGITALQPQSLFHLGTPYTCNCISLHIQNGIWQRNLCDMVGWIFVRCCCCWRAGRGRNWGCLFLYASLPIVRFVAGAGWMGNKYRNCPCSLRLGRFKQLELTMFCLSSNALYNGECDKLTGLWITCIVH